MDRSDAVGPTLASFLSSELSASATAAEAAAAAAPWVANTVDAGAAAAWRTEEASSSKGKGSRL